MINNLQTLLAITFAVLLIAISHTLSWEDEISEQEHYCGMVELWQYDKARGVDIESRVGWPPYRGEAVDCNKELMP